MSDENDEKKDGNIVNMFGSNKPDEGEPIDTRGWIIVASFSQLKGFNDNDMLNLITFLGSKGIPATYSASGFGIEGFGAMDYLVSVPPEHKALAEKVIKEYLS